MRKKIYIVSIVLPERDDNLTQTDLNISDIHTKLDKAGFKDAKIDDIWMWNEDIEAGRG